MLIYLARYLDQETGEGSFRSSSQAAVIYYYYTTQGHKHPVNLPTCFPHSPFNAEREAGKL